MGMNNINYSINVLDSLSFPFTVQLGFKAGVNDTYSISADDINSFAPDIDILLEDVITGTTTNLRQQPVYAFTANNNDNAQRFFVHFFKNPVDINDAGRSNGNIFAYGNNIYVNTCGKEAVIFLYNDLGQEVADKKLCNSILTKITVNSTGYYIVKVLSDKKVYNAKVFCKQD